MELSTGVKMATLSRYFTLISFALVFSQAVFLPAYSNVLLDKHLVAMYNKVALNKVERQNQNPDKKPSHIYYNYTLPEPNIGAVITRAVSVYFDESRLNYFLVELNWFLGSWKEIVSLDAANVRTDLIISTQSSRKIVTIFKKLGCKHRHRSDHNTVNPAPSQCIYDYSQPQLLTLYPSLREYVPYSRSMYCLTLPALGRYRYLLRSDTDAFLAPGFAKKLPTAFHVGIGGYMQKQYTKHRLSTIARVSKLNCY